MKIRLTKFLVYLILLSISIKNFSQSEIKLVNDILPEFFPTNFKCVFIINKNGFSPVYNKNKYLEYLNILDTIIKKKIAIDLLDKSFKNKNDTSCFWRNGDIQGAIIISNFELENKIGKYIFNVPSSSDSTLDCANYEVEIDSSNISVIWDDQSNQERIDTLPQHYFVNRVPPEFSEIFVVGKPVIDKSEKYGLLYYSINPFTLKSFGEFFLCEKIRGTWIIRNRLDSFLN